MNYEERMRRACHTAQDVHRWIYLERLQLAAAQRMADAPAERKAQRKLATLKLILDEMLTLAML